jgi:hypothetical protein
MAIDIDGYAVLGAIAQKPDVFPAIKSEVSKVARMLVVKQLKDKTMSAAGLQIVGDAVGLDSFDLILDLMTDAEVKTLLGKVDKLNAEAKAAAPQSQRKHVSDLAHNRAEPAVKQSKPAKPKEPRTTKPKETKPKAAPVERAASARFSKARKKAD